MRYHLSLLHALSALSIVCSSCAFAQTKSMSRDDMGAIIASLNSTLAANYAFPDMARKIAPALQEHLNKGDYDAAATNNEFASKLTDDLIKISGDLHFFVGADSKWVADFEAKANPALKARIRQEELRKLEETNFGFDELARLPGNIGYIRLSYFADPELAYDVAASAMRFVGNTDALIMDLRYNNGGYLEMAQFIASYFFSSEKDQLLFDYYYNEDGKRIARGQWVLPGLPGKRMVDKPVYILTGSTSFSSAEWFSYSMKKLGRATLIGERTAGGAHPVARKPLNQDFFVQIPIGQIQDPVDHGDFEGVGVQPDIQSPSIRALPLAHKLALENLAKTDQTRRTELAWLLPSLTTDIQRPRVDAGMLRSAAGKYEGRQLVLDNGTLYYIWRDRFRLALEPISTDLFAVEGVSDFRFRLITGRGTVTALERVNKDGSIKRYKRLD